MRKRLAKEEGKRKKFRAVIDRLGKKNNFKGYAEETVLLKNVVDTETNNVVTDHLWVSLTKGFEKISLKRETMIELDARVKESKKGYVNSKFESNPQQRDYKLSHLTKIKVVSSLLPPNRTY